MSKPIHALAQQLTGKPTLEDCSLDEIKRLAQRYPYFAPAQFLLLHKLRQSGTPEEADIQYKKAILFYPDPLQFDYFIASGNFYTTEEDNLNEPGGKAEPTSEKNSEEGSISIPEPTIDKEPLPVNEDAVVNAVEEQPSPVRAEEPEAIVAEAEAGTQIAAVHFENQSLSALEEINAIRQNDGEEAIEQEEPDPVAAGDEGAGAETVENAETAATILPSSEVPALQTQPQPAHTGFAFEPYHTVDYFASQGIKISQDELPKDKLGKGLKSFTEWLKTMKRLPATQMPGAAESPAEKKVESMADRSLTGSEVVTEAMADVWVKQGNREKALDIYNKLSLQNPSKTAYFAAKIENLKTS